MNRAQDRLASTSAMLARTAGVLLLPLSFCAAAADAADVLVHRFTLAAADQWVSIDLRASAGAWHKGTADGRLASAKEVRSVLGALQGIAIGARCPGLTKELVHYPCAFDIDTQRIGGTRGPLGAWVSTTANKLTQPSANIETALSTPMQLEGSIAVPGEAGLLALIAPEDVRTAFAEGRPLHVRVRVQSSSAPDDVRSAADRAAAKRPTQGVIVITTQPLRPEPTFPATYGGRKA